MNVCLCMHVCMYVCMCMYVYNVCDTFFSLFFSLIILELRDI